MASPSSYPSSASEPAPLILPPSHQVGRVGSISLWVGFTLLSVTAATMFAKGIRLTPSRRFFYFLSTAVATIASFAYLSMALGLGKTVVHDREMYFSRYLDWMCTTPLILTSLARLARLSVSNLFALWVLDELMIVSGLTASLVGGKAGWALYSFGCVCFIPLIYFLFEEFESDHEAKEKEMGRAAAAAYPRLGITLTLLWSVYPILWVVSGVGLASVDVEVTLYMCLDVSVKSLFMAWFLSTKPCEHVALAERVLPHHHAHRTTTTSSSSSHSHRSGGASLTGVAAAEHSGSSLTSTSSSSLRPAGATHQPLTEMVGEEAKEEPGGRSLSDQ